jgi:tRNA A37 threonylcarbamoyladenosine synthetase subunit TsaC/SUA5/YrdC
LKFKELNIDDAATITESIRVFESDLPVILIELPSVFALLAPPTKLGVEALNRVKERLSGKFYGTAIGSLDSFILSAQSSYLPEAFQYNHLELPYLVGSIIRFVFSEASVTTPTLANGTHQGLLLSGRLRQYFSIMEDYAGLNRDDSVFPKLKYSALLCTSANISGDPEGSIIDLEKARLFAKERNIALFIRMSEPSIKGGSFPIFSFFKNQCQLVRNGPGADAIIDSIPKSIEMLGLGD